MICVRGNTHPYRDMCAGNTHPWETHIPVTPLAIKWIVIVLVLMYKLSYLLFGFQLHQSFSVPTFCYFNESCQTPSSFAGGKSSSCTSILALSMQINTYGNSTNGYTSLRQRILPLFKKDCRRCRSTQQATPRKSTFARRSLY